MLSGIEHVEDARARLTIRALEEEGRIGAELHGRYLQFRLLSIENRSKEQRDQKGAHDGDWIEVDRDGGAGDSEAGDTAHQGSRVAGRSRGAEREQEEDGRKGTGQA